MSGDYSPNRSGTSGNRPPVTRNNPRPPQKKKPMRYVKTASPQANIRHKKTKKEPAYAPARRRLIIFGHFGEIDLSMFFTIIILLVIGILTMFSASSFWAFSEFGDSYYYLKRQLMAAVIGLVAMWLFSTLDYHMFQRTWVAYISFIVVWLMNLYTAFFGDEVAGAKRWIVIGGINFQPSEILKICLIIVFAYLLSANYPHFDKFSYSVAPCMAVMGAAAIIGLVQRHMSFIVIIVIISVIMLFVGGVPKKHFAVFCGIIGAMGVIFLSYKMITATGEDAGFGYIAKRIKAWQDPSSDIRDTTNQIWNSLIAIGSGGMFGQGFGESKQKYLWLSEAQNDFVFAIVCEEFGFIGAVFVVLLFIYFIFRGFYIASKATDRFGMLLAAGITVHIGIQALLNIAVATNTIPNTGISLPFFSYGRTALIIQLWEMGILLSVSKKTKG